MLTSARIQNVECQIVIFLLFHFAGHISVYFDLFKSRQKFKFNWCKTCLFTESCQQGPHFCGFAFLRLAVNHIVFTDNLSFCAFLNFLRPVETTWERRNHWSYSTLSVMKKLLIWLLSLAIYRNQCNSQHFPGFFWVKLHLKDVFDCYEQFVKTHWKFRYQIVLAAHTCVSSYNNKFSRINSLLVGVKHRT